jgi:hypothetical protein
MPPQPSSPGTLESRYSARLDDFRRGRAAAGSAAELAALDAQETEYLLSVVPFVQEYTSTRAVNGGGRPVAGGLSDLVEVTHRTGRNNVLQRYLLEVERREDPALVAAVAAYEKRQCRVRPSEAEYWCPGCDARGMLLDSREAQLVCPHCGTTRFAESSLENLTYDQEINQDIVSSFAYKRLNHFCEWLNSLQAKVSRPPPARPDPARVPPGRGRALFSTGTVHHASRADLGARGCARRRPARRPGHRLRPQPQAAGAQPARQRVAKGRAQRLGQRLGQRPGRPARRQHARAAQLPPGDAAAADARAQPRGLWPDRAARRAVLNPETLSPPPPPQENTEIPAAVVDAVKAEFKKMRAGTREEIKPVKVREFLKKLRLNKYYEHTNAICNVLNGVPPPKLPAALEDRLKAMFVEIQKPFERNCPKDRKNFMSYAYTLYKFCELLGEDQYLQYFPLLKSNEKLYLQDQIWKKICRDLAWEYIPRFSGFRVNCA